MENLVENVGLSLVSETVDQITGRSRKKWAVMLLAFVLGSVLTAYLLTRRRKGSGGGGGGGGSEAPVAPAQPPPAQVPAA